MFKYLVLLAAWCAVSYGRPHWQMLPPVPGYIPVYIQHGNTPLEDINPELAEAFHALPSARSSNKQHIAAAEDKEDNNVAEEALDGAHPPEVEEENILTEKKTEKTESIENLTPEDADKQAYEKKPKKALDHIQKTGNESV